MSYTPFWAGRKIDLEECTLLKSGTMRNAYEHENLPGLLIKTLQPHLVDETGDFKDHDFWKRWRPFGAYFAMHRELSEHLILCRRGYGRDLSRPLPIASVYGLVPTSAGLGLVVERISATDGGLAPTMAGLLANGSFYENHLLALESFFDRCRDLHIVLGDLHAGNIVYTEDRDPSGEFVCIDGYGEKAAIPIHRWSKVMNDRRLARLRKRLLSRVLHKRRSHPEAPPVAFPVRGAGAA